MYRFPPAAARWEPRHFRLYDVPIPSRRRGAERHRISLRLLGPTRIWHTECGFVRCTYMFRFIFVFYMKNRKVTY
jgi:hypothetical protein